MIAAFVLRLLLAALFAGIPSTRVFHDDSQGYEDTGMRIARYWRGEGPPVEVIAGPAIDWKFPPGIYYFYGICYFIFGSFRLVATAITSLLGTLSVMMVYRLAARLFHSRIARRAALLVAFFPSMVLWSAMALKDPVMILAILVALDAMIAQRSRLTVQTILQLFLSLLVIWLVRYYVTYFVLFAIFSSFIIGRARRQASTLVRQLVGAGLVIGLLALLGVTGSLAANLDPISLKYVSQYRHGMASTANSGFGESIDVSTPGGALAFLPIGVAVLLFGPFPWQMTSFRPLLSLPEMLIWWSMIGGLWRGLRYAATRMLGETVPLLVFSAVVCGVYALGMGNVGAAFRMRAQVLPFLFVFSSLGHYLKLCHDRNLDPSILINGAVAASSSPVRPKAIR
jgi:4-amino-4-deoxy-L-arabinose transferase-like glycosyltransferase